MTEFIKNRLFVLWPISIGFFAVIFLWGFWSTGVSALGFNVTIFILAILFFLQGYKSSGERWTADIIKQEKLFWLIPYILIGLSFSIYENPWLKWISLCVLTIILAIFVNYESLEDKNARWNWSFIDKIMTARIFSFLDADLFQKANDTLMHSIRLNSLSGSRNIIKKTILGISIFIGVAFIIIPLLSSADPVFADTMDDILYWIGDVISWNVIWRIFIALTIGFILTIIFLAWKKPFNIIAKVSLWSPDAIVGGIVLTGTLAIYLLFIGVQIDHLWVKSLPIIFSQTAILVKSGFWQLFTLSIINVIFYFVFYTKEHPFIQKILKAFTISSLLLVISASQRMFMYVKYYGLSYEKFFASYTVAYSIVLFICLIIFLFYRKRIDIFKFLVIFFMWMYAVATILPIESIIFHTNINLKTMPNSRIELYELKMLSADVLSSVESANNHEWQKEWSGWIIKQRNRIDNKAWYEKNLSNLINM